MQASGICAACQLHFRYNAPPSYGPRKFCSRKCANSRGSKKIERTIDIEELENAYWQQNCTIRELSQRFNIPYTSLRRLFEANNISLHRLGTRKRFYVSRNVAQKVYPYLPSNYDDSYQLLLSINDLVPRSIPEEYRPDVCQDLLLALITGEIEQEHVKDNISTVVKRYSPKSHLISLENLTQKI